MTELEVAVARLSEARAVAEAFREQTIKRAAACRAACVRAEQGDRTVSAELIRSLTARHHEAADQLRWADEAVDRAELAVSMIRHPAGRGAR